MTKTKAKKRTKVRTRFYELTCYSASGVGGPMQRMHVVWTKCFHKRSNAMNHAARKHGIGSKMWQKNDLGTYEYDAGLRIYRIYTREFED